MENKHVYLGGPIDGTDGSEQYWRREMRDRLDTLSISYYDPLEANRKETDPAAIVRRNMRALDRCSIALFYFPTPGQFGFGSPIEIWEVCHGGLDGGTQPIPVVICTPSRLLHVYLQWCATMNPMKVVHSFDAAVDAIVKLI